MALVPIATVDIVLQTGGVNRASFGTPAFYTSHNFTSSPWSVYTSLLEVAADFPSDSPAYLAAQGIFSQTPSVQFFKVGKLSGNTVLTPNINDSEGALALGRLISVTVTDDVDFTFTATHTITAGNDEQAVATALVTQLQGSALNVTVTDNTGNFTISSANDFVVSGVTNLFTSTASTPTGSTYVDEMNVLDGIDNDYYARIIDTRDQATVLAVAADTEAKEKIFFTSDNNADSVDEATVQTATDTLAKLKVLNYFRTVTFWHHAADTTYPEAYLAGFNLPFNAGSVVWSNIKVQGLAAAQDPSTGYTLSPTQLNNLQARTANVLVADSGIIYNREGKVVAGEWIDNIRGRDNLQSDMLADIKDLLTKQKGTKIPYNNKGINQVKQVVSQRLRYYNTNRNFIEPDFIINVPDARDVLTADKTARTLNDVTFQATLTGGIIITNIFGTLSE